MTVQPARKRQRFVPAVPRRPRHRHDLIGACPTSSPRRIDLQPLPAPDRQETRGTDCLLQQTIGMPVGTCRGRHSGPFPFITADSSLPKNPTEQLGACVASVRVWNSHPVITHHEFVLPAGVRTIEAQFAKSTDQVSTADRSERRHSAYLADLELDTINSRKIQIPGNSEEDPFLQDLFEFLPALLE
jgi:hypothetical protein